MNLSARIYDPQGDDWTGDDGLFMVSADCNGVTSVTCNDGNWFSDLGCLVRNEGFSAQIDAVKFLAKCVNKSK